ncbi:hypothetical protein A5893_01760 [Pedobacter psychrophilus]|uniref:Outer membrane protein beta-barrel domain-containing protein n=1 Tax=Pedobacter psychrophilus TaxID=1826909 RepID=A0A179DMV5_9SPHI|nr:outer membrane beta-barrel protein [Pedobacter psychrophilus]OAQ41869.1 hypothetical protein A5893_01760 [Pedobacter psychrophilus]
MKNIEDNKLDDLFRHRSLNDVDEPDFDEQAWDLMNKKLTRKDRLIFFRNSSLILLLFLFIGGTFYFLKRDLIQENTYKLAKQEDLKKEKNANINLTDSSSLVKNILKETSVQKNKTLIIDKKIAENLGFNKSINLTNTYKNQRFSRSNFNAAKSKKANVNVINTNSSQDDLLTSTNDFKTEKESYISPQLIASNPIQNDVKNENSDVQIVSEKNSITTPLSKEDKPTEVKKQLLKSAQKDVNWGFALSIGSENNSLKTFGFDKTNITVGVLVDAKISKKWLFSTGFIYGSKNYSATDKQYDFITAPRFKIDNIEASCNVLEVPLRASYLINSNKKSNLSINVGASSYFMIKEKYTYQYDPILNRPDRISIKENVNQHYLSVIEFSGTYKLKILDDKQSYLGITPYVKLPIAGIGEGKVFLKSTGLNLSYNYGFIKKSK